MGSSVASISCHREMQCSAQCSFTAAPQDMDITGAKLILPSYLTYFCMLQEAHQFTPTTASYTPPYLCSIHSIHNDSILKITAVPH